MFIDKKTKSHFYLLLSVWFIVNLFQAIFTEINPDEAYYGLYGQHLSWGYFDHPPLVALIPFFSSILFKGNLAVRFLTVCLQVPTLILIWKQIDFAKGATKKQVNIFFIVAASMVMFTVYGFTTTPDVWLLFFTAAFLYVYKQFMQVNTWGNTILLALTMAGLVYSKYQGVILIGLIVLSNFSLLRNGKFWLAGIAGIFLCLPHFYWQYANEFPSFTYHLIGRSKPFKWSYVLEYLPNQLVTFNPFTIVAAGYVFIKFRPNNNYEKSLYFVIPGFILLFWLLTYKGHAEPQWTVAASIPMMILICNRATDSIWLQKYIGRWVFGSIALLLIARVLLVAGLMPEKTQLSGKEKKFLAIQKVAADRPVIFTGSYQNPSLYSFFTGNPSTVKSSLYSRKTQFDLWKFDEQWVGKPVYISTSLDSISTKTDVNGLMVEGIPIDQYQSDAVLSIFMDTVLNELKNNSVVSLNVRIYNKGNRIISFSSRQQPLELVAIFLNKKDLYTFPAIEKLAIINLLPNSSNKVHLQFKPSEIPAGSYKFALGVMTFAGPIPHTTFTPITVQ